VAGKGTFGVVYFGRNRLTGERIAIKKVLQDKKYKNREHQILKMLKHPNNLVMTDSFLTYEAESEYLNIVMDYFSDNLYQAVKKKEVTGLLIKIYAYQIFRGLNYLSMLSIAHRDIKPQNILVDRIKHKLIISDFGSAKQLNPSI
jgi:serine/threonine protein kinase